MKLLIFNTYLYVIVLAYTAWNPPYDKEDRAGTLVTCSIVMTYFTISSLVNYLHLPCFNSLSSFFCNGMVLFILLGDLKHA